MRGRLLGDRYRLGPVIGTGGMGAVHRARDEVLGRDVAVKVLRTGAPEADCRRLRREAEYLAGVQHPNLVAVLDAGADGVDPVGSPSGGAAWFAMELVEGPDLRTLLQQRGPMAGAAVRRLLAGVLGALGAMHEAGLVHRDVTPSNILLTADPFAAWEAKLTDLGIARRSVSAPLTDVGRVIGTAAYLSPEQVVGGEVGPPCDVYALALVAVEALTGVTPFPGSAVESATSRLLRAPALPDDLAPAWRTLLTDATAVDPADRPSVAALQQAVAALPDDAGVRPGLLPRSAPATATAVRTATRTASAAASTALLPAASTAVIAAVTAQRRRRSRAGLVIAAATLCAGVGAIGSVALIGTQAVSSVVAGGAASATPRPSASTSSGSAADAAAVQPQAAAVPAAQDAAAVGPAAPDGAPAGPDAQAGPGGDAGPGGAPGPGAP